MLAEGDCANTSGGSPLAACLPEVVSGYQADLPQQRDLVNQATVGIISGGVTGTYVRIAADLADAFDQGYDLRVPLIGKGSVRNIEDLLLLRGIDIAIVQSDVLDFYKRTDLYPGIKQKRSPTSPSCTTRRCTCWRAPSSTRSTRCAGSGSTSATRAAARS